MSEFNNRMEAQRHILKTINKFPGWAEELYGLSRKAIERWVGSNHLDSSSPLVLSVNSASEALFFMANKSQEHITDEYAKVVRRIDSISYQIEIEIERMTRSPKKML